jgi:hypothetical protein
LGEFSPYWANFPLIGRIFPLLGEFSPYWAIVYLSSIFWATCIHGTSYGRIRFDKKKIFWATFWATFSKTRPAALLRRKRKLVLPELVGESSVKFGQRPTYDKKRRFTFFCLTALPLLSTPRPFPLRLRPGLSKTP